MVFTGARWSYLLSLSPPSFTHPPLSFSLPLFSLPCPSSSPPRFLSLSPSLSLPQPLLVSSSSSAPSSLSDPLCAAVDLNLKWWETKLAALTAETNSLSLSPGPIWVLVRYRSCCQHLTCDNDDKWSVCWLSLSMPVFIWARVWPC